MERLQDFYEVEQEEWIMHHILSSEGILLWPVSHLAQNNPDSEYKQYSTRRGAECELATESASRRTVQGGDSTHAALDARLLDFSQSVGLRIWT